MTTNQIAQAVARVEGMGLADEVTRQLVGIIHESFAPAPRRRRRPVIIPQWLRPENAPTAPVFAVDDKTQAWMDARHDPAFTPRYQPPKAASALRPKKWTRADLETAAGFARMAVEAWRRLGYEVVTEGDPKADGSNVTVRVAQPVAA